GPEGSEGGQDERVDPALTPAPGLVAGGAGAADGGEVVDAGVAGGEGGELVEVRELVGVAGAVEEPELGRLGAGARGAMQRVAQHAAQRRDARHGGHHDVTAPPRLQGEGAL